MRFADLFVQSRQSKVREPAPRRSIATRAVAAQTAGILHFSDAMGVGHQRCPEGRATLPQDRLVLISGCPLRVICRPDADLRRCPLDPPRADIDRTSHY